MTAGELCNRQVVITTLDTPILEAASRMRDHHVGDLVVIEEREGATYPVGILTDRDLVVGVLAVDAEHLSTLLVRDVIRGGLVTEGEDQDLSQVLHTMRTHGIRRLPIVDARCVLVGILAVDDLMEQVAEELNDLVQLLRRQQALEQEDRPSLHRTRPTA